MRYHHKIMLLMFFVQSILLQCVLIADIFQKKFGNRLLADATEILPPFIF